MANNSKKHVGNGPPQEMAPSELWAHLINIPRPFREFDFPRLDPITKKPFSKIAIWVLSQEELIISEAAAERFTRNLFKNEMPKDGEQATAYNDIYRNAASVEVLFRACRDVNDLTRPAFPSPSLMRKHFSTDEIGVLMNHYLTTQAEVGPIISKMTESEMDQWIKKLEDGANHYFLDLLSSEALKDLLRHSVYRLSLSSIASGLSGKPVATSTSEKLKMDSDDDIPDVMDEDKELWDGDYDMDDMDVPEIPPTDDIKL